MLSTEAKFHSKLSLFSKHSQFSLDSGFVIHSPFWDRNVSNQFSRSFSFLLIQAMLDFTTSTAWDKDWLLKPDPLSSSLTKLRSWKKLHAQSFIFLMLQRCRLSSLQQTNRQQFSMVCILEFWTFHTGHFYGR